MKMPYEPTRGPGKLFQESDTHPQEPGRPPLPPRPQHQNSQPTLPPVRPKPQHMRYCRHPECGSSMPLRPKKQNPVTGLAPFNARIAPSAEPDRQTYFPHPQESVVTAITSATWQVVGPHLGALPAPLAGTSYTAAEEARLIIFGGTPDADVFATLTSMLSIDYYDLVTLVMMDLARQQRLLRILEATQDGGIAMFIAGYIRAAEQADCTRFAGARSLVNVLWKHDRKMGTAKWDRVLKKTLQCFCASERPMVLLVYCSTDIGLTKYILQQMKHLNVLETGITSDTAAMNLIPTIHRSVWGKRHNWHTAMVLLILELSCDPHVCPGEIGRRWRMIAGLEAGTSYPIERDPRMG